MRDFDSELCEFSPSNPQYAQNGPFYHQNINSESTLLSRTLKVGENKVPSEFPICQSKSEYFAIFYYPNL